MITTNTPAIQNVVPYKACPGPSPVRSGVSQASIQPSASRSSHSPAHHTLRHAAIQASAAILAASEPSFPNGSIQSQMNMMRVRPSYFCVQVSQPASTASADPGHTDGAAAGTVPAAIIHRPSIHCIRWHQP